MTKISFVIKYHDGDARQGHLDMYDAATSFQGFAKALAITTHALLNNGEIRRKGNRIEGAQLYLEPSKKGSFEQLVTLVITNQEAIGASIAAAAFWDFLKWTWSRTIGEICDPETPFVKRLVEDERIEPFIGEMEEALEIPLEQAHRPISANETTIITLKRRAIGDVMKFDKETLKSVSIKVDPEVERDIRGNVTRYNILSGYGRYFADALEKTVSFKITEEVTAEKKRLLTWSLHHAQNDHNSGKLLFDARKICTSKGALKRYLVTDISMAQE